MGKKDKPVERPKGQRKPQVRLHAASAQNMYHVRFLFETRSHKAVAPFLSGQPPVCMDQHRQFLMKHLSKDREIFIIQDRTVLVGYCQLRLTGEEAGELGWVIHPDYQGNGYGRTAVGLLVEEAKRRGFARLHLYVKASNPRAFKIYSDFGFEVESQEGDVVRMSFT